MPRLIDADALVKQLNDERFDFWTIKEIRKTINEQPTIDPVKRGKWKEVWNGSRFVYECTICGQPRSGVSEWNYCPSCGAQMMDAPKTISAEFAKLMREGEIQVRWKRETD